ncbi:MAG: helix-turn-helix domain-containing protein [bacterium]
MHKIKILREHKGFRQYILAGFLGISQTELSMIENGRKVPSTALAERIAKIFGVKTELLWPELKSKGEKTNAKSK